MDRALHGAFRTADVRQAASLSKRSPCPIRIVDPAFKFLLVRDVHPTGFGNYRLALCLNDQRCLRFPAQRLTVSAIASLIAIVSPLLHERDLTVSIARCRPNASRGTPRFRI